MNQSEDIHYGFSFDSNNPFAVGLMLHISMYTDEYIQLYISINCHLIYIAQNFCFSHNLYPDGHKKFT